MKLEVFLDFHRKVYENYIYKFNTHACTKLNEKNCIPSTLSHRLFRILLTDAAFNTFFYPIIKLFF